MKPFLPTIVAALVVAAIPAQADTSLREAIQLRPIGEYVSSAAATEPYIEAIHGRHVRVRVPVGFDRVTLQQRVLSRRPARSGDNLDWKTIATEYPRGAEKVIKV